MTHTRFSSALLTVAAVCGLYLSLSGCGSSKPPPLTRRLPPDLPQDNQPAAPQPAADTNATAPLEPPAPAPGTAPQAGAPTEEPPTTPPGAAVDPGTTGQTPPTTGNDHAEAPVAAPPPEPPGFADDEPKPSPPPPEAEGLRRMAKNMDIWIDPRNVAVVTSGRICRRDGQLEMFACLKGTKEHESIVAVNTKAFLVHAAFLAMGVNPGHPVQFRPEYVPAAGPEVEVLVYWTDKDGKRRHARAQDWVRNADTGKALQHPFVFGGSGFWESKDGSEQYYLAEDGDFICVSNFASALMDLPVESSQATEGLLFEPFTDRIPPEDTPVTLVLRPEQPPVRAPSPSKNEFGGQ